MSDLPADLAELAAVPERALGLDAAVTARVVHMTGDLTVNLAVAILILAATWFAARWAGWAARRMLSRVRGLRDDRTIEGFVVQAARVAVIIIGLVAVLQRLGVQTTSIIAVLGAASLAIGLAMQGALSNVAAGVVLLVLRPYRVGDVVDIGGMAGTVQRLDLFTTQMINGDNVRIIVPNSQVLGGVIQNITGQRTRRVEIHFGVGYGADLDQARAVIAGTASAHARVLPEPAPWTGVTSLLDSAVQITLHAWVQAPDWWQVRADLHQGVKEALDAAGVEIPFPHQVDVPYGGPAAAGSDDSSGQGPGHAS